MRKHLYIILLLVLSVVAWNFAVSQTIVPVASDFTSGTEGNLNNAISAAAGSISNTIFQLEAGGYYILTGTINVALGEHLTIVAPEPGTSQATAPPQIVFTISGGVSTQYIIDCYGDLTLKNIWVRYAYADGTQIGSTISIQNNPDATDGQNFYAEGCIFDYSPCPQNLSSGVVSVMCARLKAKFINCYFKNCVDRHFRYYGRALSFPYDVTGWHSDSVLFENCTFANMGYVYMQEKACYGDNVKFNHCTFLNIMMHVLESGWWNKMSMTNSLFINTWMYGNIPAQTGDSVDWNGGTIRIDSIADFGFVVPFTEEQRCILYANNNYSLDPWLVDWFVENPFTKEKIRDREPDLAPVPQPMFSNQTRHFFYGTDGTGEKIWPRMNAIQADSGINPLFIHPPTDTTKLMEFLYRKWGPATDTNWAYVPDDGLYQTWPLRENLAYNDTYLKTAAMSGFPLGDLYRWWPTEYQNWLAQKSTEDAAIEQLLSGGGVSVENQPGIASEYKLGQNYPNPFNPTTQIEYSIPRKGLVSLKVYNLLGQEVATLYNGMQNAGNYVATFNGTGLASGVYLYKLQSANASITKKFTLIK